MKTEKPHVLSKSYTLFLVTLYYFKLAFICFEFIEMPEKAFIT
jgi:hypothetical protein